MKRIITILLLCVLLVPAAACGSRSSFSPPALITPVRRNMSFIVAARSVFESDIKKYTACSYSDFYEMSFSGKGQKFLKKYAYIGKNVSAGELIAETDSFDLRQNIEELNLEIAKSRIDLQKMIDNKLDVFDIEKLQLDIDTMMQRVAGYNSTIAAGKLYSPVNGVVIYIDESLMAGDPLTPGKVFVKIVSREKVTVELKMANSSDLFNANLEFTGVSVSCLVDGAAVPVKARLALPGEKTLYPNEGAAKPIFIEPVDPAYKFPLGTIVQVVFTMLREPDKIVIPQNIIKIINKQTYVKILEPTGKVIDTKVTLGDKNDFDVVIAEGVNEGDQVLYK
jgi:hypothetical protein